MGPASTRTYATSLPSGEIAGWNSRPGSRVTGALFDVVMASGPARKRESTPKNTTTSATSARIPGPNQRRQKLRCPVQTQPDDVPGADAPRPQTRGESIRLFQEFAVTESATRASDSGAVRARLSLRDELAKQQIHGSVPATAEPADGRASEIGLEIIGAHFCGASWI